MEDKIALYEELLEADPGSRLFLPLARLYLERGATDKAIGTLQTGLTRYQEHFEARLLLHDTLYQQGRLEEARDQLRMVSEVLRKYPAFWEHWADSMESEGQLDVSVAGRFLARCFGDRVPAWSEILLRGLREESKTAEASRGEDVPCAPEPEGEDSKCVGSVGGSGQDEDEARDPYRTKTMADILVSQGDYAQALDIYTELQGKTESSGERERLQERIDWIKEQLDALSVGTDEEGVETAQDDAETEVIHRLEKLAERLEARG